MYIYWHGNFCMYQYFTLAKYSVWPKSGLCYCCSILQGYSEIHQSYGCFKFWLTSNLLRFFVVNSRLYEPEIVITLMEIAQTEVTFGPPCSACHIWYATFVLHLTTNVGGNCLKLLRHFTSFIIISSNTAVDIWSCGHYIRSLCVSYWIEVLNISLKLKLNLSTKSGSKVKFATEHQCHFIGLNSTVNLVLNKNSI